MTHPIPAGPITCVDCGQPLTLTCAGGCDQSAASIEAAINAGPPRVVTKQVRSYREKRCPCGALFQPTGPRAQFCPACKGVRG